MQWLGGNQVKPARARVSASMQEGAVETSLEAVVRKQGEVLVQTQRKMEELLRRIEARSIDPPSSDRHGYRPRQPQLRRCWVCESTGHMKRDCPQRGGEGTAPLNQ